MRKQPERLMKSVPHGQLVPNRRAKPEPTRKRATAPSAPPAATSSTGVARSNTSTSLRELQNWGIARVVHVLGDRRDHFVSTKDVFAMFRTIARERKKREIDPTVHVLRDCIAEAGKPKSADAYTRSQLSNLLEFFELAGAAYERLEGLPTPAVLRLAKLGDKALRMVGIPK